MWSWVAEWTRPFIELPVKLSYRQLVPLWVDATPVTQRPPWTPRSTQNEVWLGLIDLGDSRHRVRVASIGSKSVCDRHRSGRSFDSDRLLCPRCVRWVLARLHLAVTDKLGRFTRRHPSGPMPTRGIGGPALFFVRFQKRSSLIRFCIAMSLPMAPGRRGFAAVRTFLRSDSVADPPCRHMVGQPSPGKTPLTQMM